MTPAERALNRLAKWRTLFTGWQLGTRAKGDPEADAVRDHREATIILRAEVSALAAVLLDTGVIDHAAWLEALEREADLLSMAYEAKFPGVTASDNGLTMDPTRTSAWMKGWQL